jgi:hypothetical protein
VGRNVTPVVHIILTSLCSYSWMLHAYRKSSKYQYYCLWFWPDKGLNPWSTTLEQSWAWYPLHHQLGPKFEINQSMNKCIHDLKKIITLMLMISHMTVLWINEHLLIWYSWICEWKKADMAFSSEKIKRTAYLQFHTQNTNKQEVFRAM